MADGRDIIEEVYKIITEVSNGLDDLKGTFSGEQFSELEGFVESSKKWIRLCRRKVWLRGREGTELAQGCLDAANEFKAALNDPAAANEAAADLSRQLESLARLIATKVQVLT
ncbi:MAG: hypothetical protein SVX38_02345 [Chloroflexota bacterium]|nr:hypothetical protein [Chloroflexota bacterium]